MDVPLCRTASRPYMLSQINALPINQFRNRFLQQTGFSFCILQKFILAFLTLCTLHCALREVSGLLHDCEASLLRVITLVWIQAKNLLVQCVKAPSESNQTQSSAGLSPRWWLCGHSIEIIIHYYRGSPHFLISKFAIPSIS